MDPRPFSLKIFVAQGDPDGLRIAERSNWIGKALVFPRPLLPAIKQREEFQQAGVYLLLGPRADGDGDLLYIGEGDPVRPRLERHYSEKDFWTWAVFFVAGPGQLNKAHVQFLEAQLVQRARQAKRVPLDNGNRPAEPTLSEADRADMVVFLENLLSMLPVLGVQAFELAAPHTPAALPSPVLSCRGKGLEARGHESTQGFVVKAGSHAALEHLPSLPEHFRAAAELRQQLIANGVLQRSADHLVFSQDYAFSSPSTAGAVVLGRNVNGRVEWKDAQGRTLKELQSRQAEG